VRFSHWTSSYGEMPGRDKRRLKVRPSATTGVVLRGVALVEAAACVVDFGVVVSAMILASYLI
jgi:hypothetical protein